MEQKKVAIQISGVSKHYKLGQIGTKTLQSDLQSLWARLRGREDPNVRIGQEERLVGTSFMALNDISLTIYKGEAVGIIGSNGAGKSTLLKLLSRVTAPTAGDIDLYGRVSSMLEVGTGFNGQMTGRENIYMNGAILGMTKHEIEEKMESIIDFSEVRDFIDTPIKRYSSGMFVKLAFAVAAHLNNEIMIMDEVLAVGDIAFQQKCLSKMKEAATREGKTVLYVSHNMNTIRELCDRCIVLEQGKVIFDGDVEQAIHHYMDKSIDDYAVEIDLRDKSQSGKVPKLKMLSMTMVDKISPVFDNNETLKMKFRLNIIKPVEKAQLRLTVRTELNQAIGTSWSKERSFTEVGETECDFEFNLKYLTKGHYYVSVGFYYMNDKGQMLLLDHATRAFKIEVLPKIEIKNWNNNNHGNIFFPEME